MSSSTPTVKTLLWPSYSKVYKQHGAKAILHTHSSSHRSAALPHSALMFAALMMGHHFSISDL
jgi:hypothetical protein